MVILNWIGKEEEKSRLLLTLRPKDWCLELFVRGAMRDVELPSLFKGFGGA